MSFHSGGYSSNDRRPFHGGGTRFNSRGRIRGSFDSGRGHYSDRGGRYNNFRGSRGGWYNRNHDDDRSPDRRSSSRDGYSDSRRYHESHRDDSFHRGYKEESSSGYRPRGGYSGGPSDEHVKYNFKSESTFKRPRDYEEYEEYPSPSSSSSSFTRISRGSNRGSSRGTTLSRIVLNRRPFGRTSLLRSRGFRSGRFGGRFSSAFLQKMKIIRTIRMRNAASGMYNRTADEEQELTDFEDNERSDEEQSSDENKNQEIDSDNVKNESSKKRAAADSPKRPIKKKPNKETDKNDKEQAGHEDETSQAENKDEVKTDKFIPLECPHCKKTYKTFMNYTYHLHSPTHKMAMVSIFQKLKRKIITLRGEQREKQHKLDAEDESTRRWYCDICQLQYKQPKSTHYSSYYHKYISQFLRPRCKICHVMFYKPISYEHHRCSLSHVKRKVYLKRQKEAKEKVEVSGEQFITLDAVGSGDDEVTDVQNVESVEGEHKEKVKVIKSKEVKKPDEKERVGIDSVSSKYIRKVNVYYCKLCATSLGYKPGRAQDVILRVHCRGRTHIRQLLRLRNEETMKKKLASAPKSTESTVQEDANTSDEVKKDVEDKEKWETASQFDEKNDASSGDDNVGDKISEDEDEVKCGNRFDKFSETGKAKTETKKN